MDKDETIEVLEYLRSTKVNWYIKPDKAWGSWMRKLVNYTQDEVFGAVAYLEDNTEPEKHSAVFGSPNAIKSACDRARHDKETDERKEKDKEYYRKAEESFRGIPGKDRTEQVIYVQAQCASEHWLNGKRDNEFFNDLLIKGQALGFEFEGVDYNNLTGSGKAWKSLCGLGTL
jgi:hypothetical protein